MVSVFTLVENEAVRILLTRTTHVFLKISPGGNEISYEKFKTYYMPSPLYGKLIRRMFIVMSNGRQDAISLPNVQKSMYLFYCVCMLVLLFILGRQGVEVEVSYAII